jgi:tRNA-binding protein
MHTTQQLINFDDFTKVQICAGTIISAEPNIKAKKPAYILKIDFGPLGVKTSSAQITDHYSAEQLIGQHVVAVMNFPVKKVAGVSSEVLVLACVEASGAILLQPSKSVSNGTRVL